MEGENRAAVPAALIEKRALKKNVNDEIFYLRTYFFNWSFVYIIVVFNCLLKLPIVFTYFI